MESKINRITDILRRDYGISGAMMYTEQISWILFLKFLSDLEDSKYDEAFLNGQDYIYILDDKFKWSSWACPKVNDKIDLINAKNGEDLLEFTNKELFAYLKGFKSITQNAKSILKVIADVVNPQIEQTVYDPAVGNYK